jgi:hypothetical protein
MKRRCVCASRSATIASRDRVCTSNHGDNSSSRRSNDVVWRINSAQIICVHVVPHFGGVLMMMSSGRYAKPSQRALSNIRLRYRTGST